MKNNHHKKSLYSVMLMIGGIMAFVGMVGKKYLQQSKSEMFDDSAEGINEKEETNGCLCCNNCGQCTS